MNRCAPMSTRRKRDMTELAGAGGCFTLPTAALGTRQQRDAQRLCLPNCAGGFASTQHRGSSGCAPPTQRRQQRTRTPTDLAAATTTTTAGRSLRPVIPAEVSRRISRHVATPAVITADTCCLRDAHQLRKY